MVTLRLDLIPGCESLKRLVDADSGEAAYFQPVQITKDGWSVVLVKASERANYLSLRAEGFEEIDGLTLDEAVTAVENLTRNAIRVLNE